MRISLKWAGVLLVAALLAACGGNGSSSGSTNVRLVNATASHASITLLANAGAAISSTDRDSVSPYAGVPSGNPTLQVNDATTGTALVITAPSLAQSQHYTLVAYESGGTVKTTLFQEDTAAPGSGTASLRIFDAANDAGALDVYVTDPLVDLATLTSPTYSFGTTTSPTATTYVALTPGTYRVRVTGAGNSADLRLDIPSISLASQQLGTVILTPTTGGTLVNGAFLLQQGAYTAAANPSARVRLVAAVSGSATVSASAGATVIATNSVAPSVGGYVLVTGGSALAISVNGNSVGAPAGGLAAGTDSTLVVYGTPGSATASLVSDDNHLPSATSNLKMRLFNGLTGAATPLQLTADFSIVASSVSPGAMSAYSVVPASTSMRLEVTSPASTTPIYSESALNVPGNAVYTLFMLGDAATPLHLLRKDR